MVAGVVLAPADRKLAAFGEQLEPQGPESELEWAPRLAGPEQQAPEPEPRAAVPELEPQAPVPEPQAPVLELEPQALEPEPQAPELEPEQQEPERAPVPERPPEEPEQ
jgi:hypothetical protein